jgi:hypothetical protein
MVLGGDKEHGDDLLIPILGFFFPVISLPLLLPERQYHKKSFWGVAEGEEVYITCFCFEAGKGVLLLDKSSFCHFFKVG